MRVIAGQYRSRRLRSLPGLDLRPTADRLRETLFDVLCAGNPEALRGSVWFDLYAGTGAVGIEALSRGAAQVYFVESSRRAAELIAQNLGSLGVPAGFRVIRQDVMRGLRRLEEEGIAAGFVFLDPPYRLQQAYSQTMDFLSGSATLRPGGRIIAEHLKKVDPGDRCGALNRYRRLEQGDAVLSFYRKE